MQLFGESGNLGASNGFNLTAWLLSSNWFLIFIRPRKVLITIFVCFACPQKNARRRYYNGTVDGRRSAGQRNAGFRKRRFADFNWRRLWYVFQLFVQRKGYGRTRYCVSGFLHNVYTSIIIFICLRTIELSKRVHDRYVRKTRLLHAWWHCVPVVIKSIC